MKLVATHAELASRLGDWKRDGVWKGELGTRAGTRIATERMQNFLIRWRAVQRTREGLGRRLGGMGRRRVRGMCVECEMGVVGGSEEGCWKHGGVGVGNGYEGGNRGPQGQRQGRNKGGKGLDI